MIEIKNKVECCGCYACFQSCPVGAIKMIPDEEGFLYPKVDTQRCINCGKCEKVCPEFIPESVLPVIKTYAAYRKNFEKRLKSSSGGIFTVLAEFVLRKNGVVFGAAFDKDWRLKHCAVHSIDELPNLQGSKYLQSAIGTAFQDVEKYLESGKIVLFSGTPCQIQGLNKYLGKDNPNLITVDLICHGVPSPEIWESYLREISKGRKLQKLQFRDKSRGIKDAPLIFKFNNGDILIEKYSENLYIKGFIRNLYLRPSCYKCRFKGADRCSDFTLGDFWGIENIKPGFSDQYGISAVMIHSEKAQKIFMSIKSEIVTVHSTVEQVAAENPCLYFSADLNPNRQKFFEIQRQIGIIKSVKKLLRPTKKEYVLEKTNQLIYYMWIMKKKILNMRR